MCRAGADGDWAAAKLVEAMLRRDYFRGCGVLLLAWHKVVVVLVVLLK